MQLLANGKQQFLDQNGAPLAGGLVYHYAPGTTNPITTYKDSAGQSANPNPIQLDSRGQAVIWGAGTFRQVVQDAVGNLVWDQVVAAPDVAAQISTQMASGTGAGLVGWIRSAVGAAATTLGSWLNRQEISVFDFMTDAQIADVRARTLTIDVTVPIQKAIAAATLAGEPLRFPRGWYKVTDTLLLAQSTALRGSNWFPADWRVPNMATTKIKLVTAAVKDLFNVDQSAASQGYVWGINVANMMLEGSNVAGSRGIFLKNTTASVIENVGITNFGRGLEIEFGMFNTYNRVNASGCIEAGFYQNGNKVTTTQTYNNCIARESAWGWIIESTATGNSFGTVWNDCGLESTTKGGLSVHRCCGFEWRGGYAENVPDDRVTKTGAIFHLWMDGDANVDPYRSVGAINGGDLGGGNFNSFTDSAIVEVGSGKSLLINGPSMKRASKGVRWDATTVDGAIQFGVPPNMVSITTPYSGPDGKMQGVYPDGLLTGGPTRLLARFWSMFLAGGQLQFPPVQNPSADPNTLDDYEEGDWIGTLVPATGSITMGGVTGSYTKIGRKVTITGLFTVTAVAAPTGLLKLTGLPFPCANGFKSQPAVLVAAWFLTGMTTESITALINYNTSYIEISKYANGSPQNMSQHVAAGTQFTVSATYFTV